MRTKKKEDKKTSSAAQERFVLILEFSLDHGMQCSAVRTSVNHSAELAPLCPQECGRSIELYLWVRHGSERGEKR